MKRFTIICLNIRIVIGEIGGTVGFIFLIVFGAYNAWQEFIGKMFH